MEIRELLTDFIHMGISTTMIALSIALVILATLIIHQAGKEQRNSGFGRFFNRHGSGYSSEEEFLQNFLAGVEKIRGQPSHSLKK